MNEIVYMRNSTIFKCWRYVYYCALEEPITLVIVFMRKINVFRVQKLNQKFELSNLVMFAHNALSCIKDHWLPEYIVIDLLLTAMLFYSVLLLLQVSS